MNFNKSWTTARFHGHELRRWQSLDANVSDVDTGESYWLSGPKRDQTDTRNSSVKPTIDPDARDAYNDFLAGHPHPGRDAG